METNSKIDQQSPCSRHLKQEEPLPSKKNKDVGTIQGHSITEHTSQGELKLNCPNSATGFSERQTKSNNISVISRETKLNTDIERESYRLNKPFKPLSDPPSEEKSQAIQLQISDIPDLNNICSEQPVDKVLKELLPYDVLNDQVEAIKCLIKAGANINLTDGVGVTALNRAAIKGDTKTVEVLLKAGADINLPDTWGMTPLHNATLNRFPHIAYLLLEHKPNIDQRNATQWTALHIAANRGYAELVKRLLKYGADRELTNNGDKTALEVASYAGHTVAITLLLINGDITAHLSEQRILNFSQRLYQSAMKHVFVARNCQHQYIPSSEDDSINRHKTAERFLDLVDNYWYQENACLEKNLPLSSAVKITHSFFSEGLNEAKLEDFRKFEEGSTSKKNKTTQPTDIEEAYNQDFSKNIKHLKKALPESILVTVNEKNLCHFKEISESLFTSFNNIDKGCVIVMINALFPRKNANYPGDYKSTSPILAWEKKPDAISAFLFHDVFQLKWDKEPQISDGSFLTRVIDDVSHYTDHIIKAENFTKERFKVVLLHKKQDPLDAATNQNSVEKSTPTPQQSGKPIDNGLTHAAPSPKREQETLDMESVD